MHYSFLFRRCSHLLIWGVWVVLLCGLFVGNKVAVELQVDILIGRHLFSVTVQYYFELFVAAFNAILADLLRGFVLNGENRRGVSSNLCAIGQFAG